MYDCFWLSDQATMDSRGCVMIVGRTKDCIIRGGENVYPAEIEEFLFQHPKILQIQVSTIFIDTCIAYYYT